MLRKAPGFAAIVLLTLALGIGANTAIFSVVEAVLLRPLPYPEPDRLAQVSTFYHSPRGEEIDDSQAGRTWELIRSHATAIHSAVYGMTTGINFVAGGKAIYVQQERVSTGFFRVLGINPVLGREFAPEEDRPSGPPVTILSYALWTQAFHADPKVLGRPATLRGEPYTIVGVMPAGFQTHGRVDLWTPLQPTTTGEGGGTNYGIITRLKPGASWAEADAEVAMLGQARIRERRLPAEVSASFGLLPLQRSLTASVRKPLLMLWAAVGVVLLIGCVNIAGLQLARSGGRTREIATRLALGSSRPAVIRHLLAESVLLAFMGGALGVGLAYLGIHGLARVASSSLGVWQTISIDPVVLIATSLLTLATSVLFGLAPAVQASGIDILPALTGAGTRGVAGSAKGWPRRALVIGEVALSMLLLVGAGLLIRTLAHLSGLPAGFDGTNVLAAKLSVQDARYTNGVKLNRLFDDSLARIRELPSVESAAVVLGLPYERLLNNGFRKLDGPPRGRERDISNLSYITPDYFRVLRIPVLRGRVFERRDSALAKPVVVVNESFVKAYMAESVPLGRHISFGGDAPREIVGIVGDVQQRPGWGKNGPLAPMPLAYIPASQTSDNTLKLVHTWFTPSWIVRSSAPVDGLAAGMQKVVESIDPDLPFASFRSMEQVKERSLEFQRFLALLLAVLAGLALLLATLGIYGLIATSVVERTRELGIRMALGASVQQAIRTVAVAGVLLAAVGVVIGSALARAATQLLGAFVWGVSAADPYTFALVAAGLLLIAALASFIPALRILRLDPAETLRHE